MKKLIAVFALLASTAFHPVFAVSTEERISDFCTRQSSDIQGDQREEFVRTCIKDESARSHRGHSRASSCTALASGRKGEDRKDFLRKCRERYR